MRLFQDDTTYQLRSYKHVAVDRTFMESLWDTNRNEPDDVCEMLFSNSYSFSSNAYDSVI